MTGPDGPSSPIYLCSLLWLQNLISCPPQPDFNQLPWKGLIAEAGAGPQLQAGVRSHKGPASHCVNLNVSRPQLLQKSQGTAANEAPLVKAGPLWALWLVPSSHPGPALQSMLHISCLPTLERTFLSKWMSLTACTHPFPRGCILNNTAEAPGGLSCSFYVFLRVRREEAWSALAHSHLQDSVGFRAVSKPNPDLRFPSLFLPLPTWYKCERAFLKQ